MADTFRYRYGDSKPVSIAFKSGTAIEIGDMIWVDSTDSYKAKPASAFTWASAVSTPSAPTVADGAVALATGLTNAVTGVKVSYNFPWGEGALSTAGTATPTANAAINLAAVALPTPALSRNIYVEDAAGSGTYKLWGVDYGGKTLITGYGIGRTPPTAISTAATAITQYNFHPYFLGIAEQRYDGTNDNAYGIKDAKVRVSTGGVFEMACASASFNVGDLVGVAKDTGNALLDQTVVAVTHELLAVGRVVKATSSETTVFVEITSPRGMMLS